MCGWVGSIELSKLSHRTNNRQTKQLTITYMLDAVRLERVTRHPLLCCSIRLWRNHPRRGACSFFPSLSTDRRPAVVLWCDGYRIMIHTILGCGPGFNSTTFDTCGWLMARGGVELHAAFFLVPHILNSKRNKAHVGAAVSSIAHCCKPHVEALGCRIGAWQSIGHLQLHTLHVIWVLCYLSHRS